MSESRISSTSGQDGYLMTVLAIDRTDSRNTGRPRPRSLRALGRSEPPLLIRVGFETYERDEIFKHDSWAATATYRSQSGERIVCKFNRRAPIGPLPMGWLGRVLARRERYFLETLAGLDGIPASLGDVLVHGKNQEHAVAHAYVAGQPLSLVRKLAPDFFDQLEQLVQCLHQKRIAYVDLHKQENVIVGDDGRPYLIDFQVSLQLCGGGFTQRLFAMLCDCDLYHVDKQRWIHGQGKPTSSSRPRPWFLSIHRRFGVPLRGLRRRFLVAIGVRKGKGYSATEAQPEVGLRREAA